MVMVEICSILASLLLVFNEVRNMSKSRKIDLFLSEISTVKDRLNCIEKVVIKILEK